MANPSKSAAATTRKRSTRSAARRTVKRPGTKKQAARQSTARDKNSPARPGTKTAALIELLNRKEGATIGDLTKATKWQPHSVRGAISGTLKKKLGLTVTSEKIARRVVPGSPSTMNEVTTIGIDLAKNVFQVHGIDGSGETVTRRRLRRSQMIAFFEKLSPCCSAKTSSMPPIWARGFALISVLSKPLRRTSSAIMTTSSVTSPF